MDPLSDEELSEILQKLESSPVPSALETRILGSARAKPGRLWNRMLSYSVRVPVLALAVMAPAFFTLGAVAVRAGRSIQVPAGTVLHSDNGTLSVPGDAADRN